MAEALSKAQGKIKGAIKDAENPFFKTTYSTLNSVWDACREPLSENGLAIVQIPHESIDQVIIETILIHISGEWIRGKLSIKPIKNEPQSIGSAITYARRYALAAIVGIAPEEDDDGEGAMGRGKKQKPPLKEPRPMQPAQSAGPSSASDSTEAQQKAIHAMLAKMGLKDDYAKMEWISKRLGLPEVITSTKELSKANASFVIKELSAELDSQLGK